MPLTQSWSAWHYNQRNRRLTCKVIPPAQDLVAPDIANSAKRENGEEDQVGVPLSDNEAAG